LSELSTRRIKHPLISQTFIDASGRLCHRNCDEADTALELALVQSYLCCSTRKLHQHPLVTMAAKHVDFRVPERQLAGWILEGFSELGHSFEVDDREKYQTEKFMNFHRTSMTEGMCGWCSESKRLLFEADTEEGTCEECYVRLRRWHRVFSELERCRNGEQCDPVREDVLGELTSLVRECGA
jgi:hypothetical protein